MINRIKQYLTRIGDEIFHTGARIHEITPVGYEGFTPIYTQEQLGDLKDDQFLVVRSQQEEDLSYMGRPIPSNDPRFFLNLTNRVMASKNPTHVQRFEKMLDGRYKMVFERVH